MSFEQLLNKKENIKQIMFDSRINCPDSIFFAMKGKINDGHQFIEKAIANGAKYIVYSDDIEIKHDDVEYIKVDDVVDAYVLFSKNFYDNAIDKMSVIGITGTNGKTTIAWILRNIIANFTPCGYIGTIGYLYDDKIHESNLNLTTPKADELFKIAKQMYDYGCTTLVLEASSEGLLTHRLDHIHFSTAVFNNLSDDHFDIHGNIEDYFNAKCILFEMLNKDDKAIINIDDQYGKKLMNISKAKNITYGIDEDAHYRAINVKLFNDYSTFDLIHDNKTYHIKTNMLAKFNIYNLLAVIAVLNENNYKIEQILPYLENIELTPGRCQIIDDGQDFNIIVDFAFTENSFNKVFDYAQSITDKNNKIIAVFGAAGDRDHNRRPATAKIADKRADRVILTYDDPHSEDMMDILLELKSYFHNLEPEIILYRFEAIKKAISYANKGDTILILGKGCDDFFLVKKGKIAYISDEKAVKMILKDYK